LIATAVAYKLDKLKLLESNCADRTSQPYLAQERSKFLITSKASTDCIATDSSFARIESEKSLVLNASNKELGRVPPWLGVIW
jgi:hypothetical protein